MIFLVVASVASQLVVAESQVSDIEARANLKGFLSKYIEDFSASGFDALKTSPGNYNNFITPSLNHVKDRNGPDALSHHKRYFEDGHVDGKSSSNLVDRPSTILVGRPLHATAQSERLATGVSLKDHGSLKSVDRN